MAKILIAGTFCSGKSTLARLLNDRIHGSVLLHEPARELDIAFKSKNFASQEVRDYLFIRQVMEENIAQNKSKIVICDAGIESNIAHTRLFSLNEPSMELMQQLDIQRYDYVFFCDHENIPLTNDGFRLTDNNLRIALSFHVLDVLHELKYKPIVLKGPPRSRLSQAIKSIRTTNVGLEKSVAYEY